MIKLVLCSLFPGPVKRVRFFLKINISIYLEIQKVVVSLFYQFDKTMKKSKTYYYCDNWTGRRFVFKSLRDAINHARLEQGTITIYQDRERVEIVQGIATIPA